MRNDHTALYATPVTGLCLPRIRQKYRPTDSDTGERPDVPVTTNSVTTVAHPRSRQICNETPVVPVASSHLKRGRALKTVVVARGAIGRGGLSATHAPAVHACPAGHVRPHAPQWLSEVVRLVSQPLLVKPSQSPEPALHT
jgi:hypothetical protein